MKLAAITIALAAQASAFAPSPAFCRPTSELALAPEKVETLTNIISEQLGVDKESIKMESSFQGDLGADSLDVVELVMAIEEEFEIEIEDEDAGQIATVGNVVEYLDKSLV